MVKVNLVDTDYSFTHCFHLFWGHGCNSYHPIYADSDKEAIQYAKSKYSDAYNGLLVSAIDGKQFHRLYADGYYDDWYTSKRYSSQLPIGTAESLVDSIKYREGKGNSTHIMGEIGGLGVDIDYQIGASWVGIKTGPNITVVNKVTERIFALRNKELKPVVDISWTGYGYRFYVDFK